MARCLLDSLASTEIVSRERVEILMRKIWFAGVLFGVFAGLMAGAQTESPASRPEEASAGAQGDVPAPVADEWGKLFVANNLDVKGNTPFHLGMTFQLYDMDGKPTETGTVEEWWAARGSQRVVVHLAGLNEDGSYPEAASAELRRDAYLVSQLVTNAVRPVPPAPKEGGAVRSETAKFGNVTLSCNTPQLKEAPAGVALFAAVCVEPGTDAALIVREPGGNESVVRPSIAKFHDRHVGMELRIAFLGRTAIDGNVTTLQSFDPTKSDVKLPLPSAINTASSPGGGVEHVSKQVTAGRLVKNVPPEYPAAAKLLNLSGSVVLHAVIGKDGNLRNLVPIASTNGLFTGPALEAAKQWKYSPYLLNGVSTETDTTLTLNFARPLR